MTTSRLRESKQPNVAASAREEPIALTEVVENDVAELQPEPTAVKAPKSQGSESDYSDFNDDAMLSMVDLHIPLTKRAGLGQRLRGRKPAAVQEIAEEAIQKGLRISGYLE